MLVLLFPTLAVPFCTWLMIGYFSSIPKELDEAALIDGANYLQILLKVFIPGGHARDHRRDHLRFHSRLGRIPVSSGLSLQAQIKLVLTVGIVREADLAATSFAWGTIMAACCHGGCSPYSDLHVPDGLLCRWSDGRRDQGLRGY